MYKSLTATSKIAKPDAYVVALRSDAKSVPADYKELDAALDGAIGAAMKRPEYGLDVGATLPQYPGAGAGRLYLVGLGGKSANAINGLRNACVRLAPQLYASKVQTISVVLPGDVGGDDAGRAIGEGLALGNLKYTEYKGAASDNGKGGGASSSGPKKLKVAVDAASRKGLKTGLITGESANIARQLAATPPNIANPGYLVKFCRKMAKDVGLKCSVIDYKKAKELGMGGLCGVGQAGSTPPALIALEHSGGKSSSAPIILVGKAITFDTGGYSIKVGGGMTRMKYDKCGGMAVIGAMHALAQLKVKRRVVGLVAAAENMIDTAAYRPDDILTMYNGVTVEVTNTDAEGRLVLADALAYGCGKYKPAAVVDLATLTGGVVVALGKSCAGAFCNDEGLRTKLFDAGESVGERLWRLPLWDEHRKQMRGEHSDIVNSAGRDAHPIQGAAFLSYFVAKDGDFKKNADVPWAHLDIAGVADVEGDRDPTGLFPKGPSGFGVRLLARAIEDWA